MSLTDIELGVLAFSLTLARVSMFLVMIPIFGERNIPRSVKISLALVLSWMWFGITGIGPAAALVQSSGGLHWLGFAVALGREAILGAMLGYAFGLLLLPAQIAGSYVAQEMGLTLATITDPSNPSPVNVLGKLFETLGILIFLCLDVHHIMFAALHATFLRWPVGQASAARLPIDLPRAVADAHQWGLLVAAPMAICLFVVVVVLAILMRTSPQLNLFSIGLSARLLVGLVAAIVFLPEMLLVVSRFFSQGQYLLEMLTG